ncbi:hypothetical protein [Clostridium sp.]|uniref:hypothetical protein n=1 Tax=Clostridium sp. TaxID=1506 RepID=UPI0029129E18|nr:hypothetical protein [Clostridium sp.]MDU4480203.1 hypothetical protein [Clostridium sp.]
MSRLTRKMMGKVVLPIIPMEINSEEDLNKYHKVRREYEVMAIKLAEYEDKEEALEETKEQILKEYALDLYEEFNQVMRCTGKIDMQDVVDILQLNEEKDKKIIIGQKYKLKNSKSEVTVTSIYDDKTVGVIFNSGFEGEVNISALDI